MSLGISAVGWLAAGTVASTAVSAYGANKASKAQAQAARDAQTSSDRQFDISRQDTLNQLAQVRADQAPYREAGYSALAKLMADQANPAGITANLAKDPGYQFRLEQGTAAAERAAAASGMTGSGAVLKALARFNQGLASDEYGARFNRLASLAGIGQTATNATQQAGMNANGQLNALGTNYAANTAANLGALGEARASGYVGVSNAIGSGIRGMFNAGMMGGGGGNLTSLATAGTAGNYAYAPTPLAMPASVTALPTI